MKKYSLWKGLIDIIEVKNSARKIKWSILKIILILKCIHFNISVSQNLKWNKY